MLTILYADNTNNGTIIVGTWIGWMILSMILFAIGTRTKQDADRDDKAHGYYER